MDSQTAIYLLPYFMMGALKNILKDAIPFGVLGIVLFLYLKYKESKQ